jgi:dolichyl-phosphate beta-glucosyltransferase
MTRPHRIALVVPCFNEEARLPTRDFQEARLEGGELEMVFVDDGSTDSTRRLLEQIRCERSGRTAVVSNESNRGKAEAVRRGMLHALSHEPDAVGYWDADLATPLSELRAFVDVLEQHATVDVVLGSRVKLMGRTIERNAWRHYIGRVFATAASLTLDLPVYDTQCGAKLFRAKGTLKLVLEQPFLSRWVFDVEILARFMALAPEGRDAARGSIYELPLDRWIDIPGSKVRPLDVAKAARDLVMIRRTYSRSIEWRARSRVHGQHVAGPDTAR